jgi:hypothetical protein
LVQPEIAVNDLNIRLYRVGSTMGRAFITVQPEDMIHFRIGRDPNNLALGYACITAIGDALAQDCEGAAYMRRNLKNGGLGMIGTLNEDSPSGVDMTAVAQQTRAQMTSEEGAGIAFVGAPVKFDKFGFSPEQMALSVMLTHAQQTICGAVGVPAQVLGIMASEKTSTFANVREAGRHAAANCLGPLWDIIAETLSYHLFPDGTKRFRFDWTNVSALQEDENDRWKRSTDAYRGGVISRGTAKALIGVATEPRDDQWYSNMDRLPVVPGVAIERPS